jgi:hypothetical protein
MGRIRTGLGASSSTGHWQWTIPVAFGYGPGIIGSAFYHTLNSPGRYWLDLLPAVLNSLISDINVIIINEISKGEYST